MSDKKVIVEKTTDRTYTIHTSVRIASLEPIADPNNRDGPSYVNNLSRIDGVAFIRGIDGYSLEIKVGACFDEDEVVEAVERLTVAAQSPSRILKLNDR